MNIPAHTKNEIARRARFWVPEIKRCMNSEGSTSESMKKYSADADSSATKTGILMNSNSSSSAQHQVISDSI